MSLCPCGSGQDLENCCGPIMREEIPAPTAEALMRARYSAHAAGMYDYLRTSVHSGTRNTGDEEEMRRFSSLVSWKGLEIISTEGGGAADETGSVSFAAHYEVNGMAQEMREDAQFVREDGAWRYLDGQVHGHITYRREEPKTGRNDPCPCGSGRKYKKCCGAPL